MVKAREQTEIVRFFRRQSLSATVIRACTFCGAPGVRDGIPVGCVCPQCGGQRQADEVLGEIWSRVWRAPTAWEWFRSLWSRR